MRNLVSSLTRTFERVNLIGSTSVCPRNMHPRLLSLDYIVRNVNSNVGSPQSDFCDQENMPSSLSIKKFEAQISNDVISKINKQIDEGTHGRLFAVIRIVGKQFKITTEDIIVLKNYFVPNLGERIRLNKVLLVGASDFTVIGRPLLNPNLVKVEATVIEKTLSHVITHFRHIPRSNSYRRTKFRRVPHTILRINSIEFSDRVNAPSIVEEEATF